jgi:hypothetical protein
MEKPLKVNRALLKVVKPLKFYLHEYAGIKLLVRWLKNKCGAV